MFSALAAQGVEKKEGGPEETRAYLADEYSVADIATFTWAKLNFKQGVDINTLPNVARWLESILARPAVQRGLAAI